MHDCFLCASAAAIKHGVNWISDEGWGKLRVELETPTRADASPAPKVRKSLASQLAR
jgi:hypothetical protein